MRLTNYLRDAFVLAVMQDVPKRKDHSEEIRKIVVDDVLSQVPKQIKDAWMDSKSRQYLKEGTTYFYGIGVMTPTLDKYRSDLKLTSKAQSKVDKLGGEMEVDSKMRKELAIKVKGVAYGCNTLKQLQELLPEFVKYMPEAEAPVAKNLPMVSNIVSDFKKAGWVPKRSAA